MRASAGRVAFLGALALPAAACGVCIEDRVAAVYDQTTIDRALGRHQRVAFFTLDGDLPATLSTRKAVIAALEASGTRGSGRVSTESASASVAYDPARVSPESLAAAAALALASRSITLRAVRIIR